MPDGRICGNDAYYRVLQDEMERTGTRKREAETELLHRVINGLRTKEKLSHADIQRQLREHWGITRSAYWIRLARIRKKYVCP